MEKFPLTKKNIPLLFFLFLGVSCNGQIKNGSSHTQQVPAEKTPRIIRTQGSQSGTASCRLQDKTGQLWFILSGEGAYRYDGKSFVTVGRNEGFLSRRAYAILEDHKGSIWFTTKYFGISRYDGKNFITFSDYENGK